MYIVTIKLSPKMLEDNKIEVRTESRRVAKSIYELFSTPDVPVDVLQQSNAKTISLAAPVSPSSKKKK